MLLSVEKRGKKIKNKGILGLMALRISEDVVRNALIQEMLCIVQGRKLKCCMGGGGRRGGLWHLCSLLPETCQVETTSQDITGAKPCISPWPGPGTSCGTFSWI